MGSKPVYKIRTVTCTGCGGVSTKRRPAGQRYCSLACYRKSRRPSRQTGKTVACAECGAAVYIPKNRKAARHFCSRSHANIWQGRRKTKHVCRICNKEFRWSPSRHKCNVITYCSLACRDADPARTAMLLAMNAAQQSKKRTKPEVAGYGILDFLAVRYIPQHILADKFCVDAFIESLGVVVQFDGDYWHGHPTKFPQPDKRQARRMNLDKSQDAYLKKCGYHVIRLWETDLLKDPDATTAKLLLFLTRHGHKPTARA